MNFIYLIKIFHYNKLTSIWIFKQFFLFSIFNQKIQNFTFIISNIEFNFQNK